MFDFSPYEEPVNRIIAFCSGKGGAGKSTSAAGLAAALCRRGRTVLIIDADEGLRCLDLMLGVTDAVFDCGDVLTDACAPSDAVCAVGSCDGLSVMQAPLKKGMFAENGGIGLLTEKIRQSCRFNYIFIDLPAGAVCADEIKCADGVFVISTPDEICVRDAAATVAVLDSEDIPSRLIINRFDLSREKSGTVNCIDDIIDKTAAQLAAVIPLDRAAETAAAQGKPLKRGRAAKAFRRLAARLEGEHKPLPPLKKV